MVKVIAVPDQTGEIIDLGLLKIRVLEDGSHTDNRIGSVEGIVPAASDGPPQHFHVMHDETFLITKGRIRFITGDEVVDAKAGDYVVVPPKAPHTFCNPFEEEGRFFCTFTPAYYVDYFRLLSKSAVQGKPLSKEVVLKAQARFATFPPSDGLAEAEI
ncbi:hypothetical protein MMC20_003154 [Loxospora ochrophaea]|nr:hypothetical protein [Loxospora ochrophaea]